MSISFHGRGERKYFRPGVKSFFDRWKSISSFSLQSISPFYLQASEEKIHQKVFLLLLRMFFLRERKVSANQRGGVFTPIERNRLGLSREGKKILGRFRFKVLTVSIRKKLALLYSYLIKCLRRRNLSLNHLIKSLHKGISNVPQ